MSSHASSRPRWGRRLKTLGSVIVIAVFSALLVASVTGRIGSQRHNGSRDVAGVAEPAPLETPTPDAGSDAASPSPVATDVPTPLPTHVPPQTIKRAKQLKRSMAWLRRGLADETTFRVGTLNVLGDSHTARGGNKKGWATGYTRMGWAYSMISRAGLDVVGFQEFETPQYHRFRTLAGSSWDVFPGPTLDRGSIRDSIAWRTNVWSLVDATSISIPYFHGQPIRRPVVKLRNIESGREVWFFNTHNPASTPRWGNNARWRAVAIARETELANDLGADGTPVVFTGDYNDRAAAFCPLTTRTELVAANGGSSEGACRLPAGPGIDWIFGSGMEFSDFVTARNGVTGRVTDHPFVYAEAYVPEEPLPPGRLKAAGIGTK